MKIVSVVIPTFGRSVNLKRAIDSCLNQTYIDIEIIVVDDNDPFSQSRIDTTNLINKYYVNNKKVKYICHPKNMNGASARNTGISRSIGEFIAFLDDDDEFLPAKIQYQVDAIDKYNAAAVYTRCFKYKNDIKIHETSYCCENKGKIVYDIFCQNIEINSSAILCKKQAIVDLGGFDVSFRRNQDYEFLIRLLRNGELICVNQPLYIMHVDSKMNQLDFNSYKKVRNKFINKFESDKNKLNFFKKINIFRLYNFDLAYYALRNKKFKTSFMFFIKSIPEPFLVFLVWPRVLRVFKQNKINKYES